MSIEGAHRGHGFFSYFIVIIDTMLRTWHQCSENEKSKSRVCADDGLVQSTDPAQLQPDSNYIFSMFERLGLKTNDKKTKVMIVRGAKAPKALSREACDNIRNGKREKTVGETHEMKK